MAKFNGILDLMIYEHNIPIISYSMLRLSIFDNIIVSQYAISAWLLRYHLF